MNENRNLYWAFGLVAGSWAICLLISGVIYFTGNGSPIAWLRRQPRMTEKPPAQLTRFVSDTEFHYYLDGPGHDFLLPTELPLSATLSAFKSTVVDSRKVGEDVFQLIKTPLYNSTACPVDIGQTIKVPCTEILHPTFSIWPDSLLSLKILQSASESAAVRLALTGTNQGTAALFTDDFLYISIPHYYSRVDLLTHFLLDPATATTSPQIQERIHEIDKLPISYVAKETEKIQLFRQMEISMSETERKNWQLNMDESLNTYVIENQSRFASTTIVKISLTDFEVKSYLEVEGLTITKEELLVYKDQL